MTTPSDQRHAGGDVVAASFSLSIERTEHFMPWKDCLTSEERTFRERRIQPRYKAQKDHDDGWGDNGEVMAFYCYRLWNEVQRLRTLMKERGVDSGPEPDWFEIPKVGPGTSRGGTAAGPSRTSGR